MTAGDTFRLETLDREYCAGEGLPPFRARQRKWAPPVVVFVRDDGWSLGASVPEIAEAWATWADGWRLFALEREGWRLRPVSELPTGGFIR